MNRDNLAMLCDFYEFTMSGGLLANGFYRKTAYFDMFFRSVPDKGGFAIAAGLEQVVDYVLNLHFREDDIAYLREQKLFNEDFLAFLRDFSFTGDISAVKEGTPVFPGEPLLTVKAPVIQALMLETFLLLTINHQSLIATKANRIVRAAAGRPVLEFGARRAQGVDGAVSGARAAYIGGCAGTSCALAGKRHGIPAGGTMAHAWVQMFDSEYEAFRCYCRQYPEQTTLLVDTYSTLKSGVPNAIRAFKDVLLPLGVKNFAIRLDSGDIAYLSKAARRMLDDAGLPQCRIVASNALDEYLIGDLLAQGAQIDVFGVGERLICAKSDPVFGGVYKLAALEEADGCIVPKIKLSENVGKITNPHAKALYRYYDRDSGKALADELCLHDEAIDDAQPRTIFDPEATWKRKTLTNYRAEALLTPVIRNGKAVGQSPDIHSIRAHCTRQVGLLWDEVKRFENPHAYYVDLSQRLWDVKQELLRQATAGLE